MLQRLPAALAVAAVLAVPPLRAEERLVLIGGGDPPRAALARFAAWAGGERARILVVLWASGYPDDTFPEIQADFAGFQPASVLAAPLAPLDPEKRRQLLDQLASASGVFFSGGDQARVMDVLLADRPLLEAFRARYRQGIVFGGTSAGTAIMSRIMITGNGDFTVIDAAQVETREGLGLLPGAIVDQHFLRRQRENRLFGLVLAHPDALGVGVDQEAALCVSGGRHAEAVGGMVMIVDGRARKGGLLIQLLKPGERFDLGRRRRE